MTFDYTEQFLLPCPNKHNADRVHSLNLGLGAMQSAAFAPGTLHAGRNAGKHGELQLGDPQDLRTGIALWLTVLNFHELALWQAQHLEVTFTTGAWWIPVPADARSDVVSRRCHPRCSRRLSDNPPLHTLHTSPLPALYPSALAGKFARMIEERTRSFEVYRNY